VHIREMGREECLRVLASATRARLACSHEGQPYVVPVTLHCDAASGHLYGFTTPGQKVEWMRSNPRVCVEVDEFAAFDQWVSVVAFGRYEELTELPAPSPPGGETRGDGGETGGNGGETLSLGEGARGSGTDPPPEKRRADDPRLRAWEALRAHPMWWEPGSTASAARSRGQARRFEPLYYRISIEQLSGHEAAPDNHRPV